MMQVIWYDIIKCLIIKFGFTGSSIDYTYYRSSYLISISMPCCLISYTNFFSISGFLQISHIVKESMVLVVSWPAIIKIVKFARIYSNIECLVILLITHSNMYMVRNLYLKDNTFRFMLKLRYNKLTFCLLHKN